MAGEQDPVTNEMDSEQIDDTLPEKENVQEKNASNDSNEKLNKLPLSRIKSIIKMDPDVKKASQDAVFILSKAAELFIQHLVKDTVVKTLSERKKTITRQHLDHVCFSKDCYSFLEGVLDSYDA